MDRRAPGLSLDERIHPQRILPSAERAEGKRKPDRVLQTNVEFNTALLLHGIAFPTGLFTRLSQRDVSQDGPHTAWSNSPRTVSSARNRSMSARAAVDGAGRRRTAPTVAAGRCRVYSEGGDCRLESRSSDSFLLSPPPRLARLGRVLAIACLALLVLTWMVGIRFLVALVGTQGALGGWALALLGVLVSVPTIALLAAAVAMLGLARSELRLDGTRLVLRSGMRTWRGSTADVRRVERSANRLRLTVDGTRIPWTLVVADPAERELAALRAVVDHAPWHEGAEARRALLRRMLVAWIVAMAAGLGCLLLVRAFLLRS